MTTFTWSGSGNGRQKIVFHYCIAVVLHKLIQILVYAESEEALEYAKMQIPVNMGRTVSACIYFYCDQILYAQLAHANFALISTVYQCIPYLLLRAS